MSARYLRVPYPLCIFRRKGGSAILLSRLQLLPKNKNRHSERSEEPLCSCTRTK